MAKDEQNVVDRGMFQLEHFQWGEGWLTSSSFKSTFMRDAVNELTRCRVTLKWSYAMAYFLAAGNQKQIFEDIQACVLYDAPDSPEVHFATQ